MAELHTEPTIPLAVKPRQLSFQLLAHTRQIHRRFSHQKPLYRCGAPKFEIGAEYNTGLWA